MCIFIYPDLPGIQISHLGEGVGTGAGQSLGQSQDEGGWRQLWLGDQMLGPGPWSSLGGVWGGALVLGGMLGFGGGAGCSWLSPPTPDVSPGCVPGEAVEAPHPGREFSLQWRGPELDGVGG